MAACFGGNPKLVIYLLMLSGIGFDDLGYEGWTLLVCACTYGHVKLVKYFLHQGADVNKQHIGKNGLLHLAVQSTSPNKLEVMKLLLAEPHGLNVNAFD